MADKTKSQKAMSVAGDQDFQSRIRLALASVALGEVESDNTDRKNFARKVLAGQVNLPAAAVAVLANPAIMGSAANAAEGDPSWGISDEDIAFAIAEGNDPAKGVFHKLARANMGT